MLDSIEFTKLEWVYNQLRGYTDLLPDLVAVLTYRGQADPLKLVFNGERKPEVPKGFEQTTITDLLDDASDLQQYNGTVFAFSQLNLVLPTLVTSGPRHCSMEELFGRLGQPSILADTQWSLACTLFSQLHNQGVLPECAPDEPSADWLERSAKLFTLALPRLLHRLKDIRGLVAVIPHRDLQRFLFERECMLVYVTTEGTFRVLGDESEWRDISSTRRLCAAFEELETVYPALDPTQHGFVDLRKIVRRIPAPLTCGQRTDEVNGNRQYVPHAQYGGQVRATVARLATACRARAREMGAAKWSPAAEAAMILEAEHWAAEDRHLDGLVALTFDGDHNDLSERKLLGAYYLTVPDALADPLRRDLDSLLTSRQEPTEPNGDHGGYVVSLRALRRAAVGGSWRWIPLHEILFRLDRPDLLASCAFLVSRDLLRRRTHQTGDAHGTRPLDLIANLAAVACHTYGLTNSRRWQHGEYWRHLTLAYANFDSCIEALKQKDSQWQALHAAAQAWWDRSAHGEDRKVVAHEALNQLAKAYSTKSASPADGLKRRKVYKMRQIFEAMLAMTSGAWDPVAVRDRLLQVGFTELASFAVTRPKDVFEPNNDPRLPSPLFLAELRRFFDLAIESHKVRTDKLPLRTKRERLESVGIRLGQRVGVDFSQENRSVESATGGLSGQSTLLFVPWHERLWLELVYAAALREHKRLITEWRLQPVEITDIRPDEVPVKHTTELVLEVTAIPGRSLNGVTITLVPSGSRQYYVLDENKTQELANSAQPQEMKYNVIFETQERKVPLQITYTDGVSSYSDQSWVTVVGLDAKMGPKYQPFAFGDAIKTEHMQLYYGRRHELWQILDSLEHLTYAPGSKQHIHIHGSRRSGKTSLLYLLQHLIQDVTEKPRGVRQYYGASSDVKPHLAAILNKTHPVVFDMMEPEKKSHDKVVPDGQAQSFDFNAFALALIRRTCESTEWTTPETDRLIEAMTGDLRRGLGVVATLTTCLLEVLAKLPENDYLLILLDELDVLREEQYRSALGHLRTLISSPKLSRIVWGVVTTYGLPEGWESTALGLFLTVQLKRLDGDDARRLVTQPARSAQVHFTPDAVNCVLEQTGSRPYLIQILCHYIIEQLMADQSNYVERAQVEAVVADILDLSEDLRLYCEHLWGRSSGVGKLLLATLAQYPAGASREIIQSFGQRQIKDRIPGLKRSRIEVMVGKAWEDIREADIFQNPTGALVALIPIIRNWIGREPHSLRITQAINDVSAEVGLPIESPEQEDDNASG